MTQKIILLVSISLLLSSCIAHKDIVYFQGDVQQQVKVKEINNQPYRLKVDDVLYIELKTTNENLVRLFSNTALQTGAQVSDQTNYYNGYTVDKQGFITIPYIQKINVLGYTTDEVSDKIKSGLGRYFKNTEDVFVLVKLSGFRYTIIGEVNNTGTKVLYQNAVNLVEAVANAGDIAITGDKKNVEVIRATLDGVQKYTVDMTQLSMFDSEVYYLQPNDIINVPPLKQKTYGTGTSGAQTLSTVITALSLITTTILLIRNM